MNQNRFIVTMQFNEKACLPIFLKHYTQYFRPENIYIIDHGSSENLAPLDLTVFIYQGRENFPRMIEYI